MIPVVAGSSPVRHPTSNAPVAQRTEHRPPTAKAGGSSPPGGTPHAHVAQPERAAVYEAAGCWFDSSRGHQTPVPVAQTRKRHRLKPGIGAGSTPAGDTSSHPRCPRARVAQPDRAPVSYTGPVRVQIPRRAPPEIRKRREHEWSVQHSYKVPVAGSIPVRRTHFHQCRISSTGRAPVL